MRIARTLVLAGVGTLAFALAGCAAQPSRPNPQAALDRAVDLLARGQTKEAVALHLTPLTTDCIAEYSNSSQRLFAARSPSEAVLYMVMAATNEKVEKSAVIETPCAEAHYLLGYAQIELGNLDEAEQHLNHALKWSPHHSQYLSELGHLHHARKDWTAALEVFNRAVEGALLSPEAVKGDHRARALRGVGYSLIELGNLDEAEKKFQECLEINPQDQMALSEIEYIQTLRRQRKPI